MTSELDIFRVAQLIVDRYGEGAEAHAQSRADELERDGDEAGRIVWLGVAEAVRMLQRTGGTVH